MKILNYKYHFLFCCFFFLLSTCAEEESVLNNEDLIFSYSFQIRIPEYEYSDQSGTVYNVRGDTNYQTGYPDTLNNMPVLAWDSIGLGVITVAIFSSKPVVRNNEITNSNDIVWLWHSGMNFGKEGYVQFIEGKNVINGEVDDSLTPLMESKYYWGVWAWNTAGNRILYSSMPLVFNVVN